MKIVSEIEFISLYKKSPVRAFWLLLHSIQNQRKEIEKMSTALDSLKTSVANLATASTDLSTEISATLDALANGTGGGTSDADLAGIGATLDSVTETLANLTAELTAALAAPVPAPAPAETLKAPEATPAQRRQAALAAAPGGTRRLSR